MNTFTDIVENLTRTPERKEAIMAVLPQATLEQAALHYILVKAVVEDDKREMARITAKFLAEDSTIPVHDATKPLLRAAKIKYNLTYGVGYPHADGTNHYFNVLSLQEPTPEPVYKVAFIPHTVLSAHLQCFTKAAISSLIDASGAEEVEYHRFYEDCDCDTKKYYRQDNKTTHVVLINPTMSASEIKRQFADCVAAPAAWSWEE